ncbi:site-specific integrase [Mycobacterium sp. TY814]|uniref:tyrosine-type recombinase/integrase n=1 Tax=unclassified Mycobacterium TaxID=2642494 RepID=UPI002741FCCC|nr:site-specific integrase [Mycobacterium sp. TY814]MDP7725097.1 site-specific integrase [Mycobacterium sp. TY814]
MTSKRLPSAIGYVEDRWHDRDGNPKPRRGTGKQYRARWVNDDGRECSASFASERAAKQHLKSVARGEYANRNGRITFSEFYDQWSPDQPWTAGTVKAMNLAAGTVTFGNIELERLRPSHIQSWIKAMQERELEPSTIRTRFGNVRSVIRAAVADRAIPFDVTLNVRLPRLNRPEGTDDDGLMIPDAGEVGALLRKSPEKFTAFIGLCAFAGLRLGEAAALKVSDIDFIRKEIRVDRQVQRVNGKQVEIRPPKYGSNRTVYAPEGLIQLLSEHVRVQVPGDDPNRWLFPGEGEHPLHQNSVGYLWRKAKASAGVDYRLHDLRHFFASGLIAEGCDVVTVQRAMGHKSPTVTLATYAHRWPNAEDRTRKAAAAMFADALATAADPARTDSG